ncbi:MAG: S1C family serine protease [Actinomycetota bacterium]
MGPNEHDEPLEDGPGDGFGDDPDDLGDEPLRGAPPDPLDRIWVHPAELPRLTVNEPGSGTGRPSRSPRPVRRLVGSVVAGATGALLTVGLLAAVGAFGRDTNRSPLVAARTPSSNPLGVPTTRLAQSVVTVIATGAAGRRIASGVCLDHDDTIVTSEALLADATQVSVVTADGTVHDARIDARDSAHGLGFLRVVGDTGRDGPTAAALAADPIAVGDPVWVVGAGSRAAAEPWLSSGLVSATTAVTRRSDDSLLAGLVETDAASHEGTLGGALVDADGAVIAVVIGRSGNGTTLALPIATVVRAVEAIADARPPGSEPIGLALAPCSGTAAIVTAVIDGSPADRAGVEPGDLVHAAAGRAIVTPTDLAAVFAAGEPGETVAIELTRGRTPVRIRIRVGGG